LKGYSTDGAGFLASLADDGVAIAGQRVAVIGAGGAARAIVDAVARAGAADVIVVNRTASRAEEAAALAGRVGRVADARALRECDVVVNATSLGMGSAPAAGIMPFDVELLRAGQVVADTVYHPRCTALLSAARDRGARTVDGLGMLVHQAVLQQQLWTGASPSAAVMTAAAERQLAEASQ
jgi:shikimate dehydrogenase